MGYPLYTTTRAGSKVVVTDFIKGEERPYIGYWLAEGIRYPATWMEGGYYSEKKETSLDLTL